MNLPEPIVGTKGVTVRTRSDFLEEYLGASFPVLDHGFIRVVDYMGDDHAIDEAARTSYGSGTKRINAAKGLINTLMRDRHTSPFEMCEIKLHIRLPIFVMRQLVRHRMASLNEYSARYSIMKDEFYLPPAAVMMHQSIDNKQGRAGALTFEQSEDAARIIDFQNNSSFGLYEDLLNPSIDLSRELARMVLPVNIYTECYWKIDLHNLFHFLMLRNDSHAQHEVRVYAEIIDALVAGWVPMAHAAFKNYRQDAISFSAWEQKHIVRALELLKQGYLHADEPYDWATDLSKREWVAFINKIKRIA